MTSKKKTKEEPRIFAVVSNDDDDEGHKILGYFSRIEDVEMFFERENIESARVLTVSKVEDAEYPPEPELEFTFRSLNDVVKGNV